MAHGGGGEQITAALQVKWSCTGYITASFMSGNMSCQCTDGMAEKGPVEPAVTRGGGPSGLIYTYAALAGWIIKQIIMTR